jgi:hypothetical protein
VLTLGTPVNVGVVEPVVPALPVNVGVAAPVACPVVTVIGVIETAEPEFAEVVPLLPVNVGVVEPVFPVPEADVVVEYVVLVSVFTHGTLTTA